MSSISVCALIQFAQLYFEDIQVSKFPNVNYQWGVVHPIILKDEIYLSYSLEYLNLKA